MSEKKHVRWLLDELPRLREQQLITAETENALRLHYSARIAPGRNYFMLALGILGTALIAAGIILIFNYNWDMLSQGQQIAVSFLPLLLGFSVSLFTLIRGKSQLWHEASAILTAAGGAVAVALLSQIYQVNGSLAEFMMLVLITSLPLIFIFDSIGLATLYSFGMFSLLEFRFIDMVSPPNLIRAAVLVGILVYLIRHQRKDSPYRIFARYLMFPVLVYSCIQYGSYCPALMLYTAAGFFLLCSLDLAEEDGAFWKNPWHPASFLLMTVMLAVGAETRRIFTGGRSVIPLEIISFWILEGILLIETALLIFRNILRKKFDVLRVMIPVMLLLVLAGFLLHIGKADRSGLLFRVGMNCFMGAFGISLLCSGFRSGSLLVFNQGMLLCAVLFALRFLSADLGLVVRGIGMIAAGLIIIGANVYLSRKKRSGKEVGHETK